MMERANKSMENLLSDLDLIVSESMEKSLSDFIVSECQLLPMSYDPLSDRINVYNSYITYCGSAIEFYIRPFNRCLDDVDALISTADHLAFREDFPVLPLDVSGLSDTIECYEIESYNKYPGFVRLRVLGLLNYSWKYKKYEFSHTNVQNGYAVSDIVAEAAMMDLNNKRTGGRSHTVRGPAITTLFEKPDTAQDFVRSVWCPQWPKEAQSWSKRPRDYGWPKIATVSEVLKNGCHVVYIQHRSCRDDKRQWRLSFSVAEVILLQSWTKIQQIVYHLLRFFAKRELIQKNCLKEDEVLCSYHLKTLMLWTCEEMSPEWWNSSSVIAICCKLLRKLFDWLNRKYCPNYFIPEANLFHDRLSCAMIDKIKKRLHMFYNPDILCRWLECNYIQPHASYIEVNNKLKLESLYEGKVSSLSGYRNMMTLLSLERIFISGFYRFNNYTRTLIKSELRSARRSCLRSMCYFRKVVLLKDNAMLVFPVPDSIYCFKYFDASLHILHTICGLGCEKLAWHSDQFVEFVEGISFKPKIVWSKYHIYPKPFAAERCRIEYLQAQGFMLILTGTNSPPEFQLYSVMSKVFLRKALNCEDSQSNAIASASLVYLAALHFATSDYQTVIDFCSAVLVDKKSYMEQETLNASCLFFIDDVVRIIGFCLLCSFLNCKKLCKRKHIVLDLRLESKVFAYYLTVISAERISTRLGLSFDLPIPTFPLDQFFEVLINRKFRDSMTSRSIGFNVSRQCVYRRTDSLTANLTSNWIPLLEKEKLIDVLTEYALEHVILFYNAISNDHGIQCNTADCYRALYLYKCREYDEALSLCERILQESDIQNHLKILAFVNVLLVPPLDTFFDRDIQSLLGFHTLFYFLRPLNDEMQKVEATSSSTFAHYFAGKIYHSKELISCSLERFNSIEYPYFIGRHFLARYLKLRCCVDCNLPCIQAMAEFAAMKSTIPFELVIRQFLLRKLQYNQENFKL